MFVALELLAGCGMIFGASLNPRLSASGLNPFAEAFLRSGNFGLNFFEGVHV